MDFENTFTVAATYISKIPELSSLVPERVLNIMSSAVGGYPLIQYLLSLHSGRSVLEIGSSRAGIEFLWKLKKEKFRNHTFTTVDHLDFINKKPDNPNAHFCAYWETLGPDIIPDNSLDFVYHHGLGPQAYGDTSDLKLSTLDRILRAGGWYVGIKRYGSTNPDPIDPSLLLDSGYVGGVMSVKNNASDQQSWVDKGHYVTIMQKLDV